MHSKTILALLPLLFYTGLAWSQSKILVLNKQEAPISGALISTYNDSIIAETNSEGLAFFKLENAKNAKLKISHIAYKTFVTDSFIVNNDIYIVHLSDAVFELETFVVEDEHAKHEDSKSTVHLRNDELQRSREISLADGLNQIAGVQTINTGVGVSKPVIRGLSGNRIVVNQNGIRQEGQQWGQDHGLEIDAFDVEEVELIKGASALQYGSDATGGVLNLAPFALLANNRLVANAEFVYRSNNNLYGSSVSLAFNKMGWTFSSRISLQDYADYKVPATEFVYNGFLLPIENKSLKNTAGYERNLRFGLGKKTENSIFRLFYSRYYLKGGFFAGAVGIPSTYSLQNDSNARDIDLPSQEVMHQKIGFNYLRHFGNKHLSIDAAAQQNERSEHSFPHFHNIPASSSMATLGQYFLLNSYAINTHFSTENSKNLKHVIGASAQLQQNQTKGFDFLLPNFTTQKLGFYYLVEKPKTTLLKLNGALRADYGKNKVENAKRLLYNSQDEVIDSLLFGALEKNYFNWTAAFGIFKKLNEKLIAKANLSRSFRIPYPNETSSNGVHHGTFRHEQGNENITQEIGYHIDGALELSTNNYYLNISAFGSFYKNFIYLSPSSKFSYLPEAGQIYYYQQSNVFLWGAEISHALDFNENLELKQNAEYVYSYNIKSSLGLPFTPPLSLQSSLEWHKHLKNHQNIVRIALSNEAVAAQNRTDRNEKATAGYMLYHLTISGNIASKKSRLKWQIGLNNLTNTAYLKHLSRYRILNIPEQGRNLVLSLHLPLAG